MCLKWRFFSYLSSKYHPEDNKCIKTLQVCFLDKIEDLGESTTFTTLVGPAQNNHCACVPLLFLRFLIVLFLCSIYQKPNTLLKYKTTSTKYNLFPSMCVPQLLFQFWIVPCVPFIFLSLLSSFADSSILPNQTTDVFPIPIVVSPPPLIYPQTLSITLGRWCAKYGLALSYLVLSYKVLSCKVKFSFILFIHRQCQ